MITRDNYEIWFLDHAEGKLNPAQQKMLFTFLEENADLKKELDSFENISVEKPSVKSGNNSNLKKKQSWLLEKYSFEELVFNFCENNLNDEELREWNDLVKAMPALLTMVEKEKSFVLKPLATENFNEKILLKKKAVSYSLNFDNYAEHFILYAETKELALHTAITNFLNENRGLKAEFELTQKLILKPDTSIVFENKNELKKKERMVAFYMWRSIAAAACIILAIIFFYPNDSASTKSFAEIKDTTKAIKNKYKNENDINLNNTVVEKENSSNNVNNVALNNNFIKNKKSNSKNKKEEISNQKIVPNILEDKKEDKNFVEVPKKDRKLDTIKPNVPIVNEKPENNLTNNQSNQKSEIGNQKSENGLKPLNAVASVINNKYYEKTTPKDEATSPFYAMKNVVRSVSGGNADISKKEDKDYKETGFKIGDFKFSRKRNKNKVDLE